MRTKLILAALAVSVAAPAAAVDFTAIGPYTIPGSGSSGTTSTYPILFNVAGLSGTVTDVNLTLTGLSHTFSDDLDILLVGPTGANVMLMSDAGGENNLNSVNYVFDQAATLALFNADGRGSGTYLPSNFIGNDGTDSIPNVTGPYGTTLNVFNGLAANGTWRLYINDDNGGDTGRLQSATLSIRTSGIAAVPESATWAMMLMGFGALGAALRRRPQVRIRFV